MAAPPTTRPVALTPRRDRRRFWQEQRATLRLRRNNRAKKGTPRRSISYPFPFSSFSISCNRDRERGIPRKGSFPVKEPCSKGSKAGPPEGFNSHLRSRGPYTHYWSEVRRPAPRRVPRLPQATRALRPLLIKGSKAGPRRVHSHLRRRARDDQGYVRYITKARAALPRYPRTFPRPAGAIL
jgi:hypothetical protein